MARAQERGTIRSPRPSGHSRIDGTSHSTGSHWVAAAILLALVAYIPAYRAGFIWDDDAHLSENEHMRSLGGIVPLLTDPGAAIPNRQWYRLTMLSFWLEYRIWGGHAAGYHVTNVLLHLASALLLWRILARAVPPAAPWLAALFALHPVMVESVAWVTERKNTLSAFCYLLSLGAFLRFEREGGARVYLLSLGLFVCALLAKTTTCTLPAALWILAWWRDGRVSRRILAATIPYFLAGILAALWTIQTERAQVGAVGSAWDASFLERCLLAGNVWWFYLGKLAFPHPLMFIYPRWEIDAREWTLWLLPAACILALAALWAARRRIGRGPLAALGFFTVTLAPASGFFDVYPFRFSFVADHFQYLAALGPLTLAGSVLGRAYAALPRARYAILPALFCLLALLTYRHAATFHDNRTLWEATLAQNPRAWIALANLGNIHNNAGEHETARAYYALALALEPDLPEALAGLGFVHAQRKEYSEAIALYERAIARKPSASLFHRRLSEAYAAIGDRARALECYERAVSLAPDEVELLVNLGWMYAQSGRLAEGQEVLERALRLDPGKLEAHLNLGAIHLLAKRYPAALEALERGAAAAPGDPRPHLNAALVHERMNDPARALASLERALALGGAVDPAHLAALREKAEGSGP